MLTRERLNTIIDKLKEYERTAENISISDAEKLKFCKSILERFEQDYEEWIEYCPFSIKSVSKYISEKYIRITGISDELYLSCARFLREYVFSLERKGYKDSWVNSDWLLFKKESIKFVDSDHQTWLSYLINGQFDIDLLNDYLGEKSFQAFLNYENNLKDVEERSEKLKPNFAAKISRLENFIKEKENNVNKLAELLKEQKTAFNFVGLSQGFENLLSQKRCAKWTSFIIMFVFCFLLIVLPMFFLGGRFLNWFHEYNIQWKDIGWEQMLPVLGLEIILIYFFRVVLNHYNSIQTQIMQLELRQSLCQFIQSYADYAKEIKEKDGVSLEKFESLIFSSILSSADKVPSTFDGLEQLANLIREFKK